MSILNPERGPARGGPKPLGNLQRHRHGCLLPGTVFNLNLNLNELQVEEVMFNLNLCRVGHLRKPYPRRAE
jgi:hypothetical protein